jgi:farnesyl-diphosphate farnesyltransferase
MRSTSRDSQHALLRAVSRSFYLTLRILPRQIRPQIALAYLLARTSDTIADTNLVPPTLRLEALDRFRARILEPTSALPLELAALARQQGRPEERLLLECCEQNVAALSTFTPSDQSHLRRVLEIILSGQELDLRRFLGATAGVPLSLETEADLDDYTYRVAGCAGRFWTDLCLDHVWRNAENDTATWLFHNGVRLGKGLQLVNILRDLAADLRQGRCYLPRARLTSLGLTPSQLLDPANEQRLRPLYDACLDVATAQLRAGWDYTLRFPLRYWRVRLACAWPVLIGLRTIDRLRAGPVLDPACAIKIPRTEVRVLILRTILCYPLPALWRRLA